MYIIIIYLRLLNLYVLVLHLLIIIMFYDLYLLSFYKIMNINDDFNR